MLISYMSLLISMMVGVAYFILLERKILSSMHLREGPKKVGVMGLIQPFSDGVKLFSKGLNVPFKSNFLIFVISPILGLMLCFISWILFLEEYDLMDLVSGFLIFLCISSVNAYVMILSGWSCNSVYGILGSYRGVAQSISYEVSSALLMMGSFSILESYNFGKFVYECGMMHMCFLSMFVWISVMLAESNRSPYDFVEGESELVSGFNVEYSSVGFSFLFLAEYGMMLFVCYLGGLIFFGKGMGMFSMILVVGFIWIRGVSPRYRYDKLMMMTWKFYLIFSLGFLSFMVGVMEFMNIFMF